MPEIQGVTISEADLEAAAIAPVRRALLWCFEFYSESWTGPARIVADTQDLTATLEDTAPRNAGEAVLFTAVPIRARPPGEGDDASVPRMELEIDGASAIITGLMDDAVASLDPIVVIARTYVSDDTSAPSRLPVLEMEFVEVRVTETTVRGYLQYRDAFNDRFPAAAYTRAEWPGINAR